MTLEVGKNLRNRSARAGLLALMLCIVGWQSHPVDAQSFDSGSDGSDGALILASNQGTVVFNPADTVRWGRVLDADGDGVYNFTSITVGTDTTLRFSGDVLARPIYFLVSGAVLIQGTLDLFGSSGFSALDLVTRRQLAAAGSGGFAGGAGGLIGQDSIAPTPGDGPGGGAAAAIACQGASPVRCGAGGNFNGNRYLIPLVGGSGGGGGLFNDGRYWSGGGGGGAILLASSISITVTGNIYAGGGSGAINAGSLTIGGSGSGGAIRLVAPTVGGTGQLYVAGGGGGAGVSGAAGVVRLERFSQTGALVIFPATSLSTGSPVDAATLRPANAVRIAAIGGVPVPINTSGSFTLPDVTIASPVAVPVSIEAKGIPPGTVVTLRIFPQVAPDGFTLFLPPVQAELQGTLQLSTATVNVLFPYGFSRGILSATW